MLAGAYQTERVREERETVVTGPIHAAACSSIILQGADNVSNGDIARLWCAVLTVHRRTECHYRLHEQRSKYLLRKYRGAMDCALLNSPESTDTTNKGDATPSRAPGRRQG